MAIDVKRLKQQLAASKAARQNHEPSWRECFDFTYPERGNGLEGSVLLPEDVQRRKNRILDDTGAESVRILASAIVTGTTPANSMWFGLSASDDTDDDLFNEASGAEAEFFSNAARIIFTNIHASNFDPVAYEGAVDLAIAGVFTMFVEEAPQGGFSFELWPLAQCYFSASKMDGPVDTIYRETEFSVQQIVNEYGLDNVDERVRADYDAGKVDNKHGVIHFIGPREDWIEGARLAKNLPFASAHFLANSEKIMREGGYHEFPVIAPRWMRTPGSVYATGPASKALGSMRTINDTKALELMNMEIAVGGQYVAVDDGVLNPSNITLGARRVVVANDINSIKELPRSGDFNVAFTAEERLQAQIKRAFMADQLQPQDGPAMTATEVHARVQLVRQLLGPIYARLRAEYLQRLVERCFGIAYRAGVLGPAPETLINRDYVVKFISPLARAQRLEDVTAMDRLESSLMIEAQIDPQVLDVYDFEKAAVLRADFLGTPKSLIRSKDEVARVRSRRAQEQQQAALQQVVTDAAPGMLQQAAKQ
jgi:hypothetical protein